MCTDQITPELSYSVAVSTSAIILCIDDDPTVRQLAKTVLEAEGYSVFVAPDLTGLGEVITRMLPPVLRRPSVPDPTAAEGERES